MTTFVKPIHPSPAYRRYPLSFPPIRRAGSRPGKLRLHLVGGIGVAALLLFAFPAIAHGATLYWVGNDGASIQTASNWKTTDPSACGGGNAGAAPGSADTAIFDADCDNGAAIDASWNLLKLQMNSGYSGTITQSASTTITIDPGSSGDANKL